MTDYNARSEAAKQAAKTRKGYSTRTGPTLAVKVALRLSEAGLQRVWAGTEKVYFLLPHSRPDTEEEAQAALLEVFPDAGFKVEYVYKKAHWATEEA